MLAGKLRAATAGAEGLPIEDLFSTYLYTGNGSTQTITNGIDLAGEGGLVWIKNRDQTDSHILTDTERGATEILSSDSTAAGVTDADTLTAFNSDGFAIGADIKVNTIAENYASWTFRKAPKFFDVVTYTGIPWGGVGTTKTINHNLGVAPACVILKCTSTTGNWYVWHKNLSSGQYILLNSSSAETGLGIIFNATSTTFEFGNEYNFFNNGETFVAYLFAHNDGDGEFGPNGDQDIIKCGSYVGGGTTNRTVTLGWEPQWVLIKKTTTTGYWQVYDNMRGMDYSGQSKYLFPDRSSAEAYIGPASSGGFEIRPTPTGFELAGDASTGGNHLNQTYIYIAIRRGPMRVPESGTEVYKSVTRTGTGTSPWVASGAGFPPDMTIMSGRNLDGFSAASAHQHSVIDRVRMAKEHIQTVNNNAEGGGWGAGHIHNMDGYDGLYSSDASYYNSSTGTYVDHHFRRAPGFFDVVAYTGTGVARTVPHNLGVAPELLIVKNRSAVRNWFVWVKDFGSTDYLELNLAGAKLTGANIWNSTIPTASEFSVGGVNNTSGNNFIAYLFATLPGVSKVGSYTGNGSSQTIDCGFMTGARFVLIKRIDSTSDWYVWDTARGIVSANDPHLSLNTNAAEVTTDDSIDPDSSGFIVNQVAATNINVSSASYIYLAIS